MSSGLAVSGVDFIPDPAPERVEVVHAKRGYRTEGQLSGITDRARSGNEAWFLTMPFPAITREKAAAMVADLERWGTVESFRTYVVGEEEHMGDATETELDGLIVSDTVARTATSTSSDVRFNAHASPTPQSIVRNDAGSWLTDGFEPGMTIVTTGAEDATNNGTRWIETVTAGTIEVSLDSPAMVTNANDTTVAMTGSFDHLARVLAVETSPSVPSKLLLKKGALIGFVVNGKNEMLRVWRDVTTDAAGQAVIELSQFIRDPPAAATPVFTRYIPIRVTLTRDPGYQLTAPILYDFRLEMQEEPGAA